MRERRVIVLARACVVVGIALAIYGTMAEQTCPFRIGILILIVAASVHLHMDSRLQTAAIAAQVHLTVRDRQRYAHMGYKAAQFDAMTDSAPETEGGAEVVPLPPARRAPQMRRNGSA